MLIEPYRRLLFIGDSITDSGRRDVAPPFGNGYVNIIRNHMLARYPEMNLTFLNKGINGQTVRDLAARWETDVIAERPDWVTIMVGINDVYQQSMGDAARGVPPQEYEDTLHRLVEHTRSAYIPSARVILMSPYIIEPDKQAPLRRQMDAYGHIVQSIALQFGEPFVNVQEAFDRALRYTTPEFWSNDQFHPEGPGHALIAQEWLKAVEFTL